MRISLMLCLPRDSATLSVVRHIAAAALEELGVERETMEDVTLALTEAAANVVKHSGGRRHGQQWNLLGSCYDFNSASSVGNRYKCWGPPGDG